MYIHPHTFTHTHIHTPSYTPTEARGVSLPSSRHTAQQKKGPGALWGEDMPWGMFVLNALKARLVYIKDFDYIVEVCLVWVNWCVCVARWVLWCWYMHWYMCVCTLPTSWFTQLRNMHTCMTSTYDKYALVLNNVILPSSSNVLPTAA